MSSKAGGGILKEKIIVQRNDWGLNKDEAKAFYDFLFLQLSFEVWLIFWIFSLKQAGDLSN